MMLTVSQGDWNANLKKIADLTRENAQLRAAIEAQKETHVQIFGAWVEVDKEQSALIEKLGACLEDDCQPYLRHEPEYKEALAELAAWRAK